MRTIKVRNVNESWRVGMSTLLAGGEEETSRVGNVLVYPEPVTTVYKRPMERVLFCEKRRANPFFHLFESMWMLAGREDATWLDQFVHDFSARYAEEDGVLHGAYGMRWAGGHPRWNGRSQLQVVIDILRRTPNTRQAVLTMWHPGIDLDAGKKDVPCNSLIYYRISHDELHQTVCCRSNDAIWGCWGANAVHMSILHEYVAAAVGVKIGQYWQVSNNLHVYTDQIQRLGLRDSPIVDCDHYASSAVEASPMFPTGRCNEETIRKILHWTDEPSKPVSGDEQLFRHLLRPMYLVHQHLKNDNPITAMDECNAIGPTDWRYAARQWCSRAINKMREQEYAKHARGAA